MLCKLTIIRTLTILQSDNAVVFMFVFQALELRRYFKSLGAEISEEKSPKGIEDDLHKIVGVCDVCFKENNEADIEAILNSIVSIMVSVGISIKICNTFVYYDLFNSYIMFFLQIPLERGENLILAFSQRLTKAPGPKLGMVSLQS